MRPLMYCRRPMRRFGAALWMRLGNCPYCMRNSFRAALIAWALTGISQALSISRPLVDLTTIAGCALTALWLGHLLAHAFKVSTATRSQPGPAGNRGAISTSRREMLPIFMRALAAAAAATSIPSLALAECDKLAAERCQTAGTNCNAHCGRAFHREEEIRACRQECNSNYAACRTEANCS